jgi:flagellar motor protein MotB
VVRTKKEFPRGNIELGAERALSVWSELSAAGIPQERMRVSSYGEYVPVDASDKSKNRRVEIRVLLADPQVARS